MRRIKIGPRYNQEGPADIGAGMTLESRERRINGKVFEFLKIISSTGAVTVHAYERVTYSETRHNVYIRPQVLPLEGDFGHHLREDCPDTGICLLHAVT